MKALTSRHQCVGVIGLPVVEPMTAPAFAALLALDADKHAEVIKEADIKLE